MGNLLVVILMLFSFLEVHAVPILSFQNKNAIRFAKTLKVGEIELLEFQEEVSLAHYGTSQKSLDYIELEKLEASKQGYKKFMIKAKSPGSGELTFKSGENVIKVSVRVIENYDLLEEKLNNLFGIKNPEPQQYIKVLSANLVSNIDETQGSHIYLQGEVKSPKDAMLALAFAASAVGDHGVKIFSNPGGQLRLEELGQTSELQSPENQNDSNNSSFVEFYESTNKLIDTNNLYRDLILSSENEKVISFIKVAEPQRFAVKVRFLEMDSRFVDEILSSTSTTSTGNDLLGSIGSTDLPSATISRASNSLASSNIVDAISNSGIARLTDSISSGGLISGAASLSNELFLNINLNNLLQEGILRVVNEFSLITHSGERVSLGKGTRFPIPQLNNSVGQSSISIEYIPIGFKGELKVTGLDNDLIDVQLASRLSSAESTAASIEGITIPVFNEEYVNSGALLADGNEVVLNAFMTETETLARSSSFLGKIIPFLGQNKSKQKAKSLLFITIVAEEIEQSSVQIAKDSIDLPHLDLTRSKNIYSEYSRKLRAKNLSNGSLDLKRFNQNQTEKQQLADPLDLEELEL